jgi:hypothetical protein
LDVLAGLTQPNCLVVLFSLGGVIYSGMHDEFVNCPPARRQLIVLRNLLNLDSPVPCATTSLIEYECSFLNEEKIHLLFVSHFEEMKNCGQN